MNRQVEIRSFIATAADDEEITILECANYLGVNTIIDPHVKWFLISKEFHTADGDPVNRAGIDTYQRLIDFKVFYAHEGDDV